MYDSVYFTLKRKDCVCKNDCKRLFCKENYYRYNTFCNDIVKYIYNIKEHYNTNDGAVYYSGQLSNLSISVNDDTIYIKNSLAKYYYGNNIKTLNITDTKNTIERLGDELHLPMQRATITRIDFGTNFIMDYKPSVYFNYLGNLSRFKRSNIEKYTLYYKQNNKCLCFYDKIKESKLNSISLEYKDKNILRYELRFTGRLQDAFKTNKLTASLLYDDNFYNKLIKYYKDYYYSIDKLNTNILDINNIKTKKDLYKMGINNLITMYGENNLMSNIDERKDKKELTQKQSHDLKQVIKQSVKTSSIKSTSIIEELTKKINSI
jgi:hypothetical protein